MIGRKLIFDGEPYAIDLTFATDVTHPPAGTKLPADGGEPGKGTDFVTLTINGVNILNAAGQTIDQGNMQYHANCRGPK